MKTSDLLEHPDSFEQRLHVGLEHIADAGSVSGPGRFDPDVMLVDRPRYSRSGRWLVGAAAAAVVVLGVGGLIVVNRQDEDPAPAQQPSSTNESASPAPTLQTPVWYSTIRPMLPDGFDQIVLTDARPEVVSFKAFRTGTRQLLDVTITLQAGFGMKDTGQAATFSDDYGDYIESAGSVVLTTRDQRQVIIRCGLRPIGGGSVETGGLLDADRDTCDDGVDNLDIDPISRRGLAVKLAAEFPTDIVTPTFGQPDTSPLPAAVTQIVNDFVGEDRPFSLEQADGVLRNANLSPILGTPSATELTVIEGMWPANGDGSALDGTEADSPQPLFHRYDGIAVAFVVVDTTGYHIATTDLSDTHLTALGELLQQLIAASTDTSPPAVTPVPTATDVPTAASTPSTTGPATADVPAGPRASLDVPGWTLSAADTGDGTTIGAEYIYTSADGKILQVNFYPGTLADRVTNEFPDDAVNVLSESQQVATYPDGRRFRYNASFADLSPGGLDWVMEVDGEPFADQNEFMATVQAITIL